MSDSSSCLEKRVIEHGSAPGRFFCGVDLHGKTLFLHLRDASGRIRVNRSVRRDADEFLTAVAPFRDGLTVAVEATAGHEWLTDLCESEGVSCVVGDPGRIRSVAGTKGKSDRGDAATLAKLIVADLFPTVFRYPLEHRAARALSRERIKLVRARTRYKAALTLDRTLAVGSPGDDLIPRLRARLIVAYDREITALRRTVVARAARQHPLAYPLLLTVPGIGPVLAAVICYEVSTPGRFPDVGRFVSYCRLVPCRRESGGRTRGVGPRLRGNRYLHWAFHQAASQMLRRCSVAREWCDRLSDACEQKRRAILAARIARAVYPMWRKGSPFDRDRMFGVRS